MPSGAMAVNPNILEMEYAVRGPIPQRAAELAAGGMQVISCHIGNPQALGQSPIYYYRQILSLIEDPSRIGRERALKSLLKRLPQAESGLSKEGEFSSEAALEMGETILSRLGTGVGAYTESKGPAFIREAVARYIDERDGVTDSDGKRSDPENIFLTNGASEGARFVIETMLADPKDGIMVPIPQYPLYSATIRRCGGVQVGYFPDEDAGWTLNRSILEEALSSARDGGVKVKAIVVINPCNPTGAVLDDDDVKDVCTFAREHGLAIIADEVYQDNVYGASFVSFAKAVGRDELPLFSLHSTSKGFHGECGHRGGYLEVRNPPRLEVGSGNFVDILLKLASVNLCSNTMGQVLTYLMVSPPKSDSDLHARYIREKEGVLRALHEKAVMIRESFEKMRGLFCFGRIGAMYLFPRLGKLPEGTTDFDYCMRLLETTGLCTVNGAGFGQKTGTWHLRIAFLPPKEVLSNVLSKWIDFHNGYVPGE
ncbi:MAG: aminotransferase class I/II-fold pyridoxal phosphate-dependent enzyme [Planctomycetota bacterium]|nr:aminotransferase class I/II-fold pyridoxal phosphate-dependent enzyme [Planctomycetota bacterium]